MAKRSLMLAGGGVKIPFQAGVLQVWLDEAGMEFQHGDAVSAACFNLAMWAQGMSGTEIASNWLKTNPLSEISFDPRETVKLLYAKSIFDLDHFRSKVFPAWGVDITKIRASKREATFNVYNFSRHRLEPVEAQDLTEDHLIATGSLPVWFPPVVINGDTYIDAVFNLATNLEEAIRRGSDELWVIWTISQKGEWFDGFVGNFFGIFEATTVHAYKSMLARIDRNNQAIASNKPGEFGRVITVRELKAEVPVHYLLNFSQDRVAEAVNRGMAAAREWCDAQAIPHARKAGASVPAPTVSLRFEEHLSGTLSDGTRCQLQMSVHIDDIDQFLSSPKHEARAEGTFNGHALPNGDMQILVDEGDPSRKMVTFRFSDGVSDISGVRHLAPGKEEKETELTAGLLSGTLRPTPLDVLKEVASFRVDGGNLKQRTEAMARFGLFYFGHLWDVYARHILPSSPV